MYTMSLYESGDSSGEVSLKDLFENKVKKKLVKKVELKRLVELIVKGGWPEAVNISVNGAMKITRSYIEAVLDKDIIANSRRKGEGKPHDPHSSGGR